MSKVTNHREPDDKDLGLAESLGITLTCAPEKYMPPLDRGLLRRFVQRELAEIEEVEVTHLIATYRSWHEAWGEVVKQEITKKHS